MEEYFIVIVILIRQSSTLMPDSATLQLIRCPGCQLDDSDNMNISNTLSKHAAGATCYFRISLHNVLSLEGRSKGLRILNQRTTVDFQLSAHYIRSKLELFAKRLNIVPTVDEINQLPPPEASNIVHF
jgi:hypothetical protein